MFRKRIIWQLYPPYLVVMLIAVVVVTWYSSYAFKQFYKHQTLNRLNTLSRVTADQISRVLPDAQADALNELCRKFSQASKGEIRVTIISPTGNVLGDSHEDPRVMQNHSDRPEVIDAIAKGFGWSFRFSSTLGKNMMYAAIPIRQQEQLTAVVRTAITATDIDKALNDIYVKIFWGGLAVAVCAAGISLVISRRISRPVVGMKEIAQRFAQGELDLRVPIPSCVELSDLAKALNEMATQLQDRILTITQQRNELEAVLSSMAEGVIAVDGQERIVSVNKAAAALLNIDAQYAQGRSVQEVIRITEIHEFIKKTLAKDQPTETDLSLPTEGSRFFRIYGASLPGSTGAVIVLNDMTRVRSLENLRRDFVANVSHELKTPITSIQGFVEALLEGAMNDHKQAERFLKIIARHSDRLNSIIEDLLTLSRLEEDRERKETSFEVTELKPVLASAIELSSIKAEEKQMRIELVCHDHTRAKINVALLEQAMLNLLDNAIKYSPSGSTIRITAEQKGEQTTISVQDNGCGIAQEHLPRIFERFYVVDKSRSRKLGGTGLGLAIVKHIAQVHGGSVTLESSPDVGSTFTIHLPAD